MDYRRAAPCVAARRSGRKPGFGISSGAAASGSFGLTIKNPVSNKAGSASDHHHNRLLNRFLSQYACNNQANGIPNKNRQSAHAIPLSRDSPSNGACPAFKSHFSECPHLLFEHIRTNWLLRSLRGEPQAAQGRPFGVSVMGELPFGRYIYRPHQPHIRERLPVLFPAWMALLVLRALLDRPDCPA